MSARWNGLDLLEPITTDQPCGENLEETLLASFDAFRLFGRSQPLEPAPEWGDVRDQSLGALRRSKDLRVLAHLGSAALRTDGLPAFCDTLVAASHWLETYWPGIYPLVDEDAVVRRNALNNFADHAAVVDGLRRVSLVTSRQHGRFSLRDVELASGQLQASNGDVVPDHARIDAAFKEMPLDELTALAQSATSALAAIGRIDARMREEAGTEATPGLESLATQLKKIDRVLRTQLAARPDGVPIEREPDGDHAPQPGGVVGPIRSRQDATRALDAVANFFRQTEPSSPVPLLLERAKRLVAMSFLEVIEEIAPSALGEARAAGGLKQSQS
jgi:type VI secretion system protein ImpA